MGIVLSFCVMISRVLEDSRASTSPSTWEDMEVLRHPISLGRLDGLTTSWGSKETD